VIKHNLDLVTAQEALLFQVFCNDLDSAFNITFVGLDVDLGASRSLVGSRDTGEF
jgi:hypothetical protein